MGIPAALEGAKPTQLALLLAAALAPPAPTKAPPAAAGATTCEAWLRTYYRRMLLAPGDARADS